jgi:hypothetical protein
MMMGLSSVERPGRAGAGKTCGLLIFFFFLTRRLGLFPGSRRMFNSIDMAGNATQKVA